MAVPGKALEMTACLVVLLTGWWCNLLCRSGREGANRQKLNQALSPKVKSLTGSNLVGVSHLCSIAVGQKSCLGPGLSRPIELQRRLGPHFDGPMTASEGPADGTASSV